MESIPPLLKPPVNRRRWWIHLALIVSYILFIGAMGLGRTKTRAPALSHTPRGLILVCGLELLLFGAVFGLACFASRPTRDDLLLRWRGHVLPLLFGIGYSVALRMVLGILAALGVMALMALHILSFDSLKNFSAAQRSGVETLVDVAALRHNPFYFWFTLTFVSFVVAGLREELWRSAFLTGLRNLWPQRFGSQAGQIGAVFIVAIFFGIGHMALGALAVCLTGLLGVGLGLIMVFHRSIWPAVIAHGMFDATTFALIPMIAGFGN